MFDLSWLRLPNLFGSDTYFDIRGYFPDPKVAAFIKDVKGGRVEGVQAGIRAGLTNAEGLDGYRPIHVAMIPVDPQVLRLLIQAKADVNARLDNGNVPLHFAVRKDGPEFARPLLAAGALPNILGDADTPVLFTALMARNAAVIELLAHAAVDKTVEWNGMAAFYWAVSNEDLEMATVLADLKFPVEVGTDTWSAFDELGEKLSTWNAEDATNRQRVRALLAALAKRDIVLPSVIVDRWL